MFTVEGFGTIMLSVDNNSGDLQIEQVDSSLVDGELFEVDEEAPAVANGTEIEQVPKQEIEFLDAKCKSALKTRLSIWNARKKSKRNQGPRPSQIAAIKSKWKKTSAMAALLQQTKKDKVIRVDRNLLPPPIRSLLSAHSYEDKFQSWNSAHSVDGLISMVLSDGMNVDEIAEGYDEESSFFFISKEQIESFPEMVMSFFLKRYGLPPIAERNLISLFISVSNRWEENARLRTVSRFFGISDRPILPPEAPSYYFYLVTELLMIDMEHRDTNRYKEVLRTKR